MKNRLLLLITLLSAMALTFACGGAATNSINANANANKATANANANTSTVNTVANTVANAANTVANMASNAVNKVANAVSNKPANTAAANKAAKPPKGSTFECNDGTFSEAKTAQGACSGHGGVKKPV